MRTHSLHMLIVLSVAACMAIGTLSAHTAGQKTQVALAASR